MSQFVDTGSRLINTHNITNIIFLDEAKRIIFETEDMMFSITEDFIKRENSFIMSTKYIIIYISVYF